MPTFEMRYGEPERRGTAHVSFYHFDVRCGDTEARIAVGLTDELRWQWDLDTRANAQEVELRLAVGYLKEHLAGVTRLRPHQVLLTAGQPPDVGPGWTARQLAERNPYDWKECKHQRLSDRGVVCTAHHPEDPMKGLTTRAACENCELPSTDILCHNLTYPWTAPGIIDSRGVTARRVVSTQCDVRSDEFDGRPGLCVPGGRNCWMQTYQPEEAAPAVVAGAVQFSIGEAIDQVNVAFGKRYGRKLFQIEHARSIEDLMGECGNDDALQHKLQVLAGLLEGMQLSGMLTDEEAEGSQGTIDLLERLVARDLRTLPQQYVRNLRNINKLSAAYPRHARVKNIEQAHEELGLPHPVSDYPKAWAIVRETFVQTLRQLALHLG